MNITKINITENEIKKFRLFTPYNYHQTLWHGFEDKCKENQPFVFRLIPSRSYITVLLYSSLEHNGKGIFENSETKSIDFPSQMGLHFDIVCNPTKNVGEKRMAILDKESLKTWIENKFEQYSCKLTDFVYNGYQFIQTGKNGLELPQVRIEGGLKYSDKENFKKMLTVGLGRAKFAGNGMICVTK